MRPDQPIPFIDRLGDALEVAAEGQISQPGQFLGRRRALVVTVASLISLVFVGVLVAVLSPSPAAAGVQIDHAGNDLVIRLADLENDAEGVRNAIAGAGLDVDVESVPVSPSLVGRFISSSGTDSTPDLTLLDVDGDTFRGFRIPADFDGRLELRLGRLASPGERYLANGSAYGPGEPLECSGIFGMRVTDAAPILSQLHLTVRWQTLVEGSDGPTMVEVKRHTVAEKYVTDALSLAPDEVLIFAASEPVSPFANGLGETENDCP